MTNSQTLPCKIGDRIEVGNYFGTIKYIGPIEGKSSVWLGIDWDIPERGKHNGSVNEIQYFTTKHPTSGSFVRPEKVTFGKSALSSIESRYGHLEDEFSSKINQQKHLLLQQTMNAPFLEMVGFDKVFNKQSNFNTLRVVNLRNQNVSFGGPGLKLGETCPNIEELDLSKNLLVSWDNVIEICDQLPKLYWLNVSENQMDLPKTVERKFINLKTLICGHMGINWSDVCEIIKIFPDVEEFRVPHNEIINLNIPEDIFTKLKLLDIEANNIELWSEISKLGYVSSLEQLNLENIGLNSIEFEGETSKVLHFNSLKKLSIVNNRLCEWRYIGELNRLKNLQHLKIFKNPVTESDKPDTVRQIIIARIANLKILNGVEIEPGERRGAEYDYIKKYGLEWLKVKGTATESDFLKLHNRFSDLIEKYGEPEESELIVKSTTIKTSLIDLKIVHEDRTITKKMPLTITVQKLMVLIQKLFKLNDKPQLTYVSSTDKDIEFLLEDELKEIGVYSMQDGDVIAVKT